MPGLADLPGLATRLSAALTEAKVPHAVSGAIAMAAHGFVRATMDLAYVRRTITGLLPEGNPRVAEFEEVLRQAGGTR